MWVPFFVLWTLPFWLLVGVVCIVLIIAVEYESPFWATASLVVTGLLLWLFGNVNVFALAVAYPLWAFLGVLGYFAAGTLWSVGKWYFFVSARREEYNEKKAEFLKAHGLPENGPIPEELKLDWWHCNGSGWGRGRARDVMVSGMSAKDVEAEGRKIQERLTPRVRDNKRRILTWMAYWPWSMFWTVLNDPVKRLFKYIYAKMKAVYQKIVDRVFKGVGDDFAPPANLPPPPTPDDSGNGRGKRDTVTPGMDSSRVSAWDDGSGNAGRNPEVYNPYGGRPAK